MFYLMFLSIFVRCGTGHHLVVFLAPLGGDFELLCTRRYPETRFQGSSNDRNEYAVKSKQCVKCKHVFPPRDVGATKLRASAPAQLCPSPEVVFDAQPRNKM